jgi:hypothetical protein
LAWSSTKTLAVVMRGIPDLLVLIAGHGCSGV